MSSNNGVINVLNFGGAKNHGKNIARQSLAVSSFLDKKIQRKYYSQRRRGHDHLR